MPKVVSKDAKKRASPFVVRGFKLTKRRILATKNLIKKSPHLGRTAISLNLCKRFRFYQQNGWPKDRAMRDILRRLHAEGAIKLPASRKPAQNPKIQFNDSFRDAIDASPISEIDWKKLTLTHAKDREQVRLWDYLIEAHHYLGKRTIVGRNLRQLGYLGSGPIKVLADQMIG